MAKDKNITNTSAQVGISALAGCTPACTPVTRVITWNANGGSVSPTSWTRQVGTALGTLPTPTRSGHSFQGWYTASTGGVARGLLLQP